MTFLTPWLLLGVLTAAVPFVVHLLNRPRYRREAWGAMMFLRQAIERRIWRIKMQQRLLTAVRVLLLAFLALALSRPVLRAGNLGAADQATTHVIIIDGSYSMRQGENRDNAFEQARAAGLAIADQMRDEDNALVIWAGAKPRALTARPVSNRQEVRALLEALEPGWERADLPKALEQAMWMLEYTGLPRHRLYVLTDGQAESWRMDAPGLWEALAVQHAQRETPPRVYALHQRPAQKIRNVALTDLRTRDRITDTHRPALLLAALQNFGGVTQAVDVALFVDEVEVDRKNVALRQGLTSVDFEYQFTRAGSHAVEVVCGEDDLSADNRRALAVEVQQTLPVLIVEGRGDGPAFQTDGALLSWALEAGTPVGAPGLFRVSRIPETDAVALNAARLSEYRVVIFVNVRSLPGSLISALEQFAGDGGGVLVSLGDRIIPAAYNRLYDDNEGLLPGRIGALRTAETALFRLSFGGEPATQALNLFDAARTRHFADVRVDTFFEITPAGDAVVAGHFGGSPFLLVKPYGRGVVALWATTMNLDWATFPVVPDFVPLVQNLMLHLASGLAPPVNLAQGETIVYAYAQTPAPAGLGDREPAAPVPTHCTVVSPRGETNRVAFIPLMGEPVAYWPETSQPGLYRVACADAPPRYFAVGLPAGEGDLAAFDAAAAATLAKALPITFVPDAASLALAVDAETGVRDLSGIFLWLALLALFADLLLAWVFSG